MFKWSNNVLPLALIASIALSLPACNKDNTSAKREAGATTRPGAAVSLAAVRVQALDRTVEVVGTLYGDEQATISAKVPGRIGQIAADVGDRIAPGALLARIEPTDYELAVQQREMAVRESLAKLGLTEIPPDSFDVSKVATVERSRHESNNAAAKLERAKKLHVADPPLISDQDFADIETAEQVAQRNYDVAVLEAQAQVAQARSRSSDLAAAKQRLADTAVRAPGASTAAATQPDRFGVSQRLVSEGEYVREGDPLFRVVADNPVKFRPSVAERYVADFHTGQAVHVRVAGYDRPFEGRVSRISPAIDIQSRMFEIEILVQNKDHLLRPGAFARGLVVVGQDASVPFVPKAAIVSFAGVDRVFSVRDGKAVEHLVTLGPAQGDTVAVRTGLKDVDQVVTTGNERLSNDAPVSIQPAAAASADGR